MTGPRVPSTRLGPALASLLLLPLALLCGDLRLAGGQLSYVAQPLSSADVQTVWSATFDGPRSGGVSHVYGAAVDPNDGTVVLAGAASGTYLGHTSLGDMDAFVVKMAPAGYVVWARWFATVLFDQALAVDIDFNGNIAVAGSTAGSMPGLSNLGSTDIFVASLTANGDQRWLRQFGTTSADYAADVAVDVYGGVFTAWQAYQSQAAALTKLSANGTTLFSQVYSGFTAYLSSSGNNAFVGSNYLPDAQRGLALVNPVANLSTEVSVVLALLTVSASSFPWASFADGGASDIIVCRVNASSGVPLWSRVYQTAAYDLPADIAIDSAGSVWLAGATTVSIEGGTYTGAANWNGFLSKLSLDGTKLFTVQFGAGTANVIPYSLLVDNAGGVFVACANEQHSAQPLLDGLPSLFNTAGGTYPFYGYVDVAVVSKYDSDGFRLWTAAFDSTTPSHAPSQYTYTATRPLHMAFDGISGQLYIVGDHSGLFSSDVDPLPRLADADYALLQSFVVAAQQPAYNVSLAQYQDLLSQLDLLLNITMA